MFSDAVIGFATNLFGTSIPVALAALFFARKAKLDRKNSLFEEKRRVYAEYLAAYQGLIVAEAARETEPHIYYPSFLRLLEATTQVHLFAPEEVLQAAIKGPCIDKPVEERRFEEIAGLMRKDLRK